MSELKKELEQDKDFVEEVSNRIYSDKDDIDEYMPEPEWIDRMTDIADKYITRFELAQKLADKHLSSKHLQLDDNQKIVLEWLKANVLQDRESAMSSIFELGALCELRRFNDNDAIRVDDAYCELSNTQEFEVLTAFAQWGLEQEGKLQWNQLNS